jgi:antitoxin MazE
MKTKLIRIGNSQGVRIPRPLIDEIGLEGDIEMSVEGEALMLRPAPRHPRAGWDEAFEAAGPDDIDFEDFPASDWDEEEWTWP